MLTAGIYKSKKFSFITNVLLENMAFLDCSDEKFSKFTKKSKVCNDTKNLLPNKENIVYLVFLYKNSNNFVNL